MAWLDYQASCEISRWSPFAGSCLWKLDSLKGGLQEQALSNSWQYNCQDSRGGFYMVYRDQSDIGLPKVTTFPQKVTIHLQLVMLSPKYVNLRALSSIFMSRISHFLSYNPPVCCSALHFTKSGEWILKGPVPANLLYIQFQPTNLVFWWKVAYEN